MYQFVDSQIHKFLRCFIIISPDLQLQLAHIEKFMCICIKRHVFVSKEP